jgi:hypothetical protein
MDPADLGDRAEGSCSVAPLVDPRLKPVAETLSLVVGVGWEVKRRCAPS